MNLNPEQGILVFTDGSAYNKDRSGAWAWVALDAFEGFEQDCFYEHDTTISRMELMAAIEALESLHQGLGPCEVLLQSDSQYVVLGFTHKGRARNANNDLWDRLEEAAGWHTHVQMEHVKGHAGHVWNEHCDKLASNMRKQGAAEFAKRKAA